MRQVIIVFVGGGLGSVARFALGKWINAFHNTQFPWGTFAVNVTACCALGFFIGIADQRQLISHEAKLFWTIGFCGGFSTFSTFSNENLVLLQSGFTTTSLVYIVTSVVLCILATFGGLYLGESI